MDVDDVIELRVHGVSGTPPASLLGCPNVVQVAGDATAGFYRPRFTEDKTDAHRTANGDRGEPVATLEGYSWGGLTSGAASRALWLLLLPFTLSNIAPRMRPPVAPNRWVRLLWLLSRVSALVMTMLLVASAAGVGMDLFGWQCGRSASCTDASPTWVMKHLVSLPLHDRLVLGGLVPLLVLVLLWKVSDKTINQYEAVTVRPAVAATHGLNEISRDNDEPGLDSPWMWRNEFPVRRMRHLHLQAGLGITLWIGSGPATGPWSWLQWNWARYSLLAVFAIAVVLLCSPTFTGRRTHGHKRSAVPGAEERSSRLRWYMGIVWGAWGYLLVYGVCLASTLLFARNATRFGGSPALPYFGTTLTVTVVTLAALTVAFAVTTSCLAMQARKTPLRPVALYNLTGIMFAGFAFFSAAVFSAGFYTFAIGWLTTGSLKPGLGTLTSNTDDFSLPWVTKPACIAYTLSVVGLALVAVLGAVVGLLWRWRVGQGHSRVTRVMLAQMYPDQPEPESGGAERAEYKQRAKTVRKALWAGRLVDHAQWWLVGLFALGTVLSIAVVAEAIGVHLWRVPGDWYKTETPDQSFLAAQLSAKALESDGAYLVVMTLVLLVTVVAAAFRVPATRKHVGVLWDLASFWPRLGHPFAAACYAERTVPDLTTRLANYGHPPTGQAPKRVILAGHSQGSVISTATLFQLDTLYPAEATTTAAAVRLPWIAFLTFGCVLRRLFARYFPTYFGEPQLAALARILTTPVAEIAEIAEVPWWKPSCAQKTPCAATQKDTSPEIRWRNLWRYSDYLGGKVMSGPPATECTDPPSVIDHPDVDPAWARAPGDTRWPAAHAHSDYWDNETFQEQVKQLRTMLDHVSWTR